MSSATPASTNTSTSPSFWQVMPIAPACHLHLPDRGDLVGLDVGAVADAVAREVRLHPADIVLHDVHVEW